MTHWRLLLLLSFSTLNASVYAEASARRDVESQYRKAVESTKLRFYDGCVSMRHPDFRALDKDGRLINLSADRWKLLQIFATAVSINEELQILSLEKVGDSELECETKDVLEFVVCGASLKQAHLFKVTTHGKDRWRKTNRGWRLFQSHITSQRQEVTPWSPGKSVTGTNPSGGLSR